MTDVEERRVNDLSNRNAWIFGVCLLAGLIGLGLVLGGSLVRFKRLDRTVVVKGLSEREVPADVAIWPLTFSEASDSLGELYDTIAAKNALIVAFLGEQGLAREAVTVNPPNVVDRRAQLWGSPEQAQPRYVGTSTVTVYTSDVQTVRSAMSAAIDLGQRGIALGEGNYGNQTQFLFTGLNDLKPAMIEEATRNAREVAEKFAADSDSRLGKIKSASQGQFSISDRDSTTTHVKKVRVVSTIEYYLVD